MRALTRRAGAAGPRLAALASCLLAGACATAMAAEPDAQRLADAAVAAADNRGEAFAVVDKKKARVYVFDAQGRLQGDSPVLLGLARGDDSVPGIGERKMSDIKPGERTTPAGRFASEPGRNLQGEDIVWVDYDAAVSMHRVRANNKAERRLQRLASPSVADNRISYGCINVPASFYDTHIRPVLGQRKGVVYVLPESAPMQSRFSFSGLE
ncbi:L,D-transpeptidase [Variovorax boronicumulans]|uniref:L,D-transpeptidase n=1 Tax=Variovorax boronicumulans TaxID=436515 RepID=UPI003393C21F